MGGERKLVAIKRNKRQAIEFDYEELRAYAVPEHPNIVRFVGVVLEKEGPLFVMDLLSGGSLAKVLESDDDLALLRSSHARLARLLFGVLSGLAHLHAQQFVHRDLAASTFDLISN